MILNVKYVYRWLTYLQSLVAICTKKFRGRWSKNYESKPKWGWKMVWTSSFGMWSFVAPKLLFPLAENC